MLHTVLREIQLRDFVEVRAILESYFVRVVAEDPKAHDLGRELLGVRLGVVVSDPDQQQVAQADGGNRRAVDRDRRAADALQHHPH